MVIMQLDNCNLCSTLCNKRINIFNDNQYCIVPPCSMALFKYTENKYFLSGKIYTQPEHGDTFETLYECINYMINNYDLSLESFLKLTKVLATS